LPPEAPPVPAVEAIRHVHLVAVAGTAMGTLACMLADRGFEVTGSDVDAYPPMSDQLAGAGIEVQKGFSADRVLTKRPDLVVIGNAVRRDNPEAVAVLESGVPYLSLPDALCHFFLAGKHSVVVTGTHGKTTTTSLLGWMLTKTGRDPSFLIGGVARNFDSSFRLGQGEHFVVEGDEYDTAFFDKTPKFLHYNARSVLLTSCEFDHADIYGSLDEIRAVFTQLIDSLPADARITACADYPAVAELVADASVPVETYGFTEKALWKASDVCFDATGTQFSVWRGDERIAQAKAPLWGRHNVENALGAVAMCAGLGVDPRDAIAALAEFEGVRRRFEVWGEASGGIVVEDFAHHPTAVRETLAAARARYPEHVLWAVFEPRTATSRRRYFEADLGEALSSADRVVIADVYRADQIPDDERLRPEQVVRDLADRDVRGWTLPGPEEIIEHLAEHRSGRDVFLIMSNGGFGGIWERVLARLQQLEA